MSVSSFVVPEGTLSYREITACRACGNAGLQTVLDLGTHAVSDFYATVPANEPRAPLVLVRCGACTLVQLRHTVDRDRLYRNYHYRSGINESMVAALKDVVDDAMARVTLGPGDCVLDIGANDGSLLRQYPPDVAKIGVEPATNLTPVIDVQTGWLSTYFPLPEWGREAMRAMYPQPKIVTSIAQFYNVDDPNAYVAEIKRILHPAGVWVCQMMDLPSMLKANAVDNICAEHLTYYSTTSFRALVRRHGLQIVHVSHNAVNGGSARYVVKHRANDPVGEIDHTLYRDELPAFARRVEQRKEATVALLNDLKQRGKVVFGYGASTKGSTLLQYYQIGSDLLPAIAERNPDKVGCVTAGMGIPIISEEEARERKPDYLFIGPWHFLDGFMAREAALREQGTRFIVPLPDLRIV